MEQVTFKSNVEYFLKEEDNRKPNTVRVIDMSDKRFQLLHDFSIGEIALKITIINEELCASFTRIVKDVSFWEGLAIISWKEKDEI